MNQAIAADDLEQLREQVQKLVDRGEITDLISRLGLLLDEKDFDSARSVFTEDVSAKFPAGHIQGVDDLAESGRQNIGPFAAVQHVITNLLIALDGNRATARANLIATHVHRAADPGSHFDSGVVYHFGAVRTPDGWRLSSMELEHVWSAGTADEEWLERVSA